MGLGAFWEPSALRCIPITPGLFKQMCQLGDSRRCTITSVSWSTAYVGQRRDPHPAPSVSVATSMPLID